jgi:hypothetical protein
VSAAAADHPVAAVRAIADPARGLGSMTRRSANSSRRSRPYREDSPPIYRAPIRARVRDDVPSGAGADHAIDKGLVGIGDVLPVAPGTLEDAVEAAGTAYGAKAGRMLDRFAGLPVGTLIWTRTSDGMFHLGQIAGPWRYDDSTAARAVGIHHVRPARWLDRPFAEHEVPAAVADTFGRGGRNLQRMHDAHAERRTADLWNTHVARTTDDDG